MSVAVRVCLQKWLQTSVRHESWFKLTWFTSLVLVPTWLLTILLFTYDCILTIFRENTVIKTSGDKDNKVSWSWNLPLQISPTSKLQWPFTWDTSLALMFRRSSRWIYHPYVCLLAKKILPIGNLHHLLWHFISANPKIPQCSHFFRMFPGISAVECGLCT